MIQKIFDFEKTDNEGWLVTGADASKIFSYTSVERAIKNTSMRAFYPKQYNPTIKKFRLIFEVEEQENE